MIELVPASKPSSKKSVPSSDRLPCGRARPQPEAHSRADERTRARWREKLERYLATQNLKRSEQRWQLADLILEEGAHLSAQQIVQKVATQLPGIGAATVYRNLKVLCDAQILRETLSDASGRAVYEPFEEDHHDHMVCLDCNAVFEFASPEIEKIQDALLEREGFREERHRHVVYVRCEKLKR
jgi:Fur family ferric uptake transcriptional regulator